METLTPENALAVEHNSWLSQPVTIQLIKNLQKHREAFVSTLVRNSGNSESAEHMFRVHAYGVQTVDAILFLIKDTNKFVEYSK